MKLANSITRDYLFLSYLENFHQVPVNHLKTLKTQWIRISIIGLAYLSNLDVCAKARGLRVEREPSKWWRPQLFGVKYIRHSNWWRRQRYTWLADVILILYWLSSFYLMFNMYHQYSLDFDKLRLKRLKAMVKLGLLSEELFKRLAEMLLLRIDHTTSLLRSIGAPHRHMSMIIECVYLYMLMFAFITYYCNYLLYRIFTPLEFHFVRDLLEPEEEQHYSNELIENQVRRFIELKGAPRKLHNGCFYKSLAFLDQIDLVDHFVSANKSFISKARDGTRVCSRCLILEGGQEQSFRSRCSLSLEEQPQDVSEFVTRMHQSGALRPYNKSLDLFERRNNYLFSGFAFIIIFCFLFFATLLQSSLARRDTSAALSLGDLAIFMTLFALVLSIGYSSTLIGGLFSVSSVDQVIMVEKMRELILACIANNSHQFKQLNAIEEFYSSIQEDASDKRQAGALLQAEMKPILATSMRLSVHKMNANFLFIFLQYKIFLAQYQPARRAMRAAIVIITLLILLISVVIKLHLPYLSMFNFTNIKWIGAGFSVASLLPANFVVVPICHLEARFKYLHRVMSSLVAHIAEVESQPIGRSIYDEEAVSVLLKEMRHTYQSEDQPNREALGMPTTYTTLIKVHFWVGIVMLSIIADNQDYSHISQLSTSTSFFNDPFGVFSHSRLLKIE